MISAQQLQSVSLLACLDSEYLDEMASYAADITLRAGEYLFYEGDVAAFYVVLDGIVDIERDVLRKKHVIASYSTGQFFGEVPLLLGSAAIGSCRARTEVRVARLDRQIFRELMMFSKECSATVIDTMTRRISNARAMLNDLRPSDVVVVGDSKDRRSAEIRKFLAAVRTPYKWVDRQVKEQKAKEHLGGTFVAPSVVVDTTTKLINPTDRELAKALGTAH